MAKKKRNKHYIMIRGTGDMVVRFGVPVINASKGATFLRLREHVLRGEQGAACSCANAEAGLDGLGGYGWSFTKKRAYQIIKVNQRKEPTLLRVYVHNQDGFQEKYDRLGKEALLGSPDCEAEVALYAPRKRPSLAGVKRPGPPSKKDKSRVDARTRISRSELARFERRGVIIPTG